MTALEPKVEIVLDLAAGFGPFLKLDDPVSGKLDDPNWFLGGVTFIDVTEHVRSVAISRGRSSVFTSFPAGNASISFNNHLRLFDPEYAASPFAGNIIPKREVRISSGTAVHFSGWIDDWNLSYTPDGNSIAEAVAYDATSLLANRVLTGGTPTTESSGDRVSAVLDDPLVSWPAEARSIDTGVATLGSAVIEAGANALSYLQQVAASEAGNLFIDKAGSLTFQSRDVSINPDNFVVLGGTGIPFQNIEVVYGSENLYNNVTVSRIGGGTATAQDQLSIDEYGLRSFTLSEALFSNDDQSVDLALYYASRYSQPEYRFNSLEVALHKLSDTQQYKINNLELGDFVVVAFTPNDIGDPITRLAQVIRIDHQINPETHFVDLGFQSLNYSPLILNDPIFGKLDTNSVV